MKKLLCALAFVITLAAGYLLGKFATSTPNANPNAATAPTPDAAKDQPPTSPPPAGYALAPARHNFGKLLEGEARVIDLTLTRPADQPLRMGRLYSPCPCIRVDSTPRFVEAGKPIKVTVFVHSLTLEGKKSFPVYVELLEPRKAVLRADVDVDVDRVPARLMLNPESFHLGTVTADKSATVKLTNLTKQPLRILEASSSLADSKVEVKGPRTIGPGEAVELQLSASAATLSPGPVRSEVLLKTDCPLHAEIKIPVDGTAANRP